VQLSIKHNDAGSMFHVPCLCRWCDRTGWISLSETLSINLVKILRVLDHSIGRRMISICGNKCEVSPLKTSETLDENLNLKVRSAVVGQG